MSHTPFGKHPVFRTVPFLIAIGMSAKLVVDTTVQFFNPFLVVIASGVGIGTVTMGRIVAIRSLTGLVAPVLGSLADRIGHRTVIRASLLLMGVAMLVAPATGSVVVFAIAVALTGVAQVGYTPNLHAYLSTRLPYERRATGMGIIEYAWALAGIVGLFVSGYLIDAYSWKVPFYAIGSTLIVMSLLFGLLPGAEPKPVFADRREGGGTARLLATARDLVRLGEHASSAWGAIVVTGLNMYAMLHLLIIHGGWLQSEYGLSASSLGTVALIFGFADLVASVSVSLFVDRIGKRRSVIIGVVGMALGFAALPVLNRSLALAVIGIAIPRMSFEFAVVSSFPLLSEQAPASRGKVLSLSATAGLLGTTLAGLTGPAAYLRFGVWGLAPVSLGVSLVSLAILLAFVRDRPGAERSARP